MARCPYASNDLLNALFVALHLQEGLDLADGQVLPVAESDQLIEGAEQLVGISEDLTLVQAPASAGNHLGEEVERIDVLKDVGLLVGNENHVQLIQWLVNEADIVLFDRGVLGTAVGEFGKGEQERLEPRAAHLVERPGQNGLAAARANRSCENDHLVCCRGYMWWSGSSSPGRRDLFGRFMDFLPSRPKCLAGCQSAYLASGRQLSPQQPKVDSGVVRA